MTSASCSDRTALPRNATDVTIRSTTAVERNALSGMRRPSLKMTHATTASAMTPSVRPRATQHAEPRTERQQRLVEERGLEALAVDRGEADQHQRSGGTDRHRGPHAGAEELHPALLLEPGDQPERHVEEHHDGEERGDRLEDLAADRERVEHGAQQEERDDRGPDGRRPCPRGSACGTGSPWRPRGSRAAPRPAGPLRAPRGR